MKSSEERVDGRVEMANSGKQKQRAEAEWRAEAEY
jgi:hypothetical protein